MSSTELYVKDARVWIPHAENVWQGAVVLRDYKEGDSTLELITDRKEAHTVQLKSPSDLPHLRNPAILIGQNDLTALSYLHEPDVLYNLEVRFCDRHNIYTYCGIVLVAINPYAELPLYGAELIRAYRGHSMGELEPHIFAVAEEAYAKLEREKCDISIIVSGESGAGKTVSAKYAMRYFAAVGGSESETQIEKKVLASSPIMEAIGNAKTTRNDNSSRFGKFTKLLFTNHLSMMSLTGGTMQTYLLEKSRVVFQAPGERNYHIFYQLCAARQQWPELMLDHQDKFHFLNQGHSPDIVRVSDEDQFRETVNAFKILGFDDGEISDIMKVLAAVLHLGNVEFTHKFKKQSQEVDQEACNVASDDLHVNIFSDILKLNRDELRKWLITRQIESINDTVLIPQSKAQSEAARDALAKHIYAEMFQYIVHKINRNLAGGKKQNCFIGVLDIYGFETFEVNSFEQFCINYANEKLQQQFNQHVFKLEQEQYLKEGIEWKMIDFYDNQPCIDLIETKLGILDLLDEECRMPRGSDESWVGKLFEKCSKYKHFDKPRFGTSAFLIKHFSDTVQYESHGFLEKNRDTVSKELVNVLRLSKMKLCHKLMTVSDESPTSEEGEVGKSGVKLVVSAAKSQPMTQKQQRKTVGSQFRESLTLLITTLHNTTPHYVRCIKPNDDKAAFQWEAPKIVQQLRACGVLETVRISAAGFPSRWTYEDFYDRYRLLCKRVQIVDWNVKATCGNIVRNWLTDPDKYRLGNTQIFFRAGQVAYLEQLRSDLRKKHIIKVQSLIRRFICRNKYLRLKRTALGLQRHARGMLARKRADNLRKNRAAIKIQRYVRGWLQRIKYRRIRRTALRLQTYARGLLARRKFKQVLDNYKATQIQRFCRGYLARQRAHQRLANIIKCQATIRRFLARRMFKRLKAEARTISHIQKMYKGLENKIIELQQRYDQISKENAVLKKQNADIPEMRQKMVAMKQQENDLKALKLQLEQKDEKLLVVIKQLENERDEKMILLEEKQKEEEDRMRERAAMEQDLAKMREQVNEISDVTKLERDRLLSQADSKEIHVAYQRMVEDKNQLENENSNLRHELRRLQHLVSNSHEGKTHSRSVSNASSTNEEDYGYNSGKNTLEIRRSPHSYEGEINNNSKRYSGNGGGNVVTRGSNAAISPTAAGRPPAPAVSSMSNGPTSIGSPPPSMTSGNTSSSQNSLSDTRTLPKDSSLDFERVLNRTPVGLFSLLQDHSTPNNAESAPEKDQTAIILKMRMLFEEEKSKSDQLRKEIARFRKSSSFSTEDSIRASELEVEIEKLRQDYNLLRNSIKRGVEDRELMEQHNALQEELKRRRDECISLKAVLAQQSHSLRTLGQSQVNPNGDTSLRIHDEGELMEAFQAQKLVNRQLESELRAMMDASNETLVENNKVIEALRKEVQELQAINQGRLDTSNEDNLDSLKRSDQYLRHELKKSTAAYVDLQEQVNELLAKINELTKKNNILSNRLRDHGLNDSIIMNEEFQSMVVVKKKAHSFQGILKYRHEDENKIIQRLVTDLKPRVAVTLMPSLPAYVVFMCIRYTDSVNTDQLVRSLLTRFVQMIKRLYKLPNVAEVRVMWLVNTLTLHNLLKQFGGYQDYMQYNTEEQNLQQLKNFDLSEYRQVIYELIILMHGVLLRQVQESIKQYIVPAILDHDETARGKSRGRTMSLDMSPEQSREPKSLVQQLDTFYKHLSSFGMESNYIEQIFKQLMYYICAVAVNSLMLRGDLCVWKTGMKIHYNVGCLERWVRSMSMDPDVFKPLEPLYQISRILQARKTVEDVPTLLELSTCLTTAQILKIIKSYTTDDCENEITPLFIETLARQLNERSSQSEADTYMMDEEIVSPLVVVYKYSEINLKEIELPEELNLDGLVTKI